MKPLKPICTSLLLLVLGTAVPLDAQHDSRERDAQPSKQKQPREGRPEPRERRRDPRPEPRQEPRREPRPAPREQRPDPRPEPRKEQRHEARPEPRQEQRTEPASRQDRGRVPQAPRPRPQAPQDHRPPTRETRGNQDKHRSVWQEHRAKNWQAEHRSWQDRGGYRGYRIPTARYRSHFGPSYGFRMYSYPLIVVGGLPRFQYGGFWFSVMDPWPEYWSDNWYGDDDVYIEYSGDGYYLYNRRHTTDRIAITVILN